MEKNTKKKKLSGWDRKKMKEVANQEKESSKCQRLDAHFSFGKHTTSAAPEVEPSEDLLPTFGCT